MYGQLPHLRPGRTWLIVEAVLLLAILAVALTMRLDDLEGPRSTAPDLFDEGQDAESLLLMARGFWPYRDIYVSQGPFKLPLLYPFFVLFGGTLGAARLGVGLLSVIGLLGAWWSARQVAGAVGGLAAVFLLAASPSYLEHSRLALAEVPSIVPSIWAIGCALRWRRVSRERWLYAAVALGTMGVLVKPMALPVLVPIGLLILLKPGLRLRQIAIAIAIAVGMTAVLVLIMSPVDVYEQVVGYRLGAREGGNLELRKNFKQVISGPLENQPGLFILAVAGALLLIGADWRSGVALASWPLATMAVLLTYFPLHPKHLAYIFPPLTLVGGAGLGRAAWLAWSGGPAGRTTRLVTVGIAALIAALPLAAVYGPPRKSAARDIEIEDADLHVFDRDAVQSIVLLSEPDEFIITDHPYLALLAQRKVPPRLVDISFGRIRAHVLGDRDIKDAAERFDTRLMLPWAHRLRRISGVPSWLERRYVHAHVFGDRSVKQARGAKDRTIYLRRDTDLAGARTKLEDALAVRETTDFEGKLRLLGATVSSDTVAVNEQFTLTVGFLALAPMSTDYHLTVHLLDPDGEIRHEQELDLDGGERGTSQWDPGRWIFRTVALRPEEESPAGEYKIQMSIVDPKRGRALRAEVPPGAQYFYEEKNEPGTLTVATVTVR